jgi:prepilin-type N-terminal cleavage/methylation domain-containing protein
MRSIQSIRPSRAERGFTLIELLVATAVVSIVMAAAGALFATTRAFIQEQIRRIETLQALRATLDSFARDLRLGGACLPINGTFMSLGGTNAGTIDGVVTRTGLVQPNLTCIDSTLNGAMAKAATTFQVLDNNRGFQSGMRIYILNPNTTGEYFNLTSANGTTLGKSVTLTQDYPTGSAVYAIDERQYAIDTTTTPTIPTLTIAINGAAPAPFAAGVESVNIQYELAQNCPNCTVRDLPLSNTEWALVNQIYVTVTVRSRTQDASGNYYRRTGKISAKPRNLLPG